MWKEIDQIELPRIQRGVDYGRDRSVLAQKDDKVLILRPGHSTWSGVGQPWCYTATEINLTMAQGTAWGTSTKLFEGRISKAKIAASAEKIAEWFGVSIDELPPISRNKTFIWED